MRSIIRVARTLAAAVVLTGPTLAMIMTAPAFAAEPDWNLVAQALGKSGSVHIEGHGDPVKLASAIHAGLASSKTPFTPPPGTSTPANIDMIGIDRIMGYFGQDNGGVYQFGISRAKPVSEQGMALPGPMGAANAINFQPTGFNTAAITGDFVLLANEVNPVIGALAANGIEVTALHSHMLSEEPRVFFMHFWANDDALKLAKGLRAALDHVDVKKDTASAR